MKISIIGASAGLGLATLNRALDLGHQVTTLSRRPIMQPISTQITKIRGDALKEADLKLAIKDADAILVTLGTNGKIKATTLFSQFAKLIVKINEEEKINAPIIIVTGFGTDPCVKYIQWYLKLPFKILLGRVYKDKTLMEDIIANSSLKWEFVRPGVMNNKPVSEMYRVETMLFPSIKIRTISRNDVADYIVKEAVNQTNIHKYVAITQH